jgi:hypothetical protein
MKLHRPATRPPSVWTARATTQAEPTIAVSQRSPPHFAPGLQN